MNGIYKCLYLYLPWMTVVVKGELFFIELHTSADPYSASSHSPYLTLNGTENTDVGTKLWENGYTNSLGMVTNILFYTEKAVGHVININLTSGGIDGYAMQRMFLQNGLTGESCHVVCGLPPCRVDSDASFDWPYYSSRETSGCTYPSPPATVNDEIQQAVFKSIPINHQAVSAIGFAVPARSCVPIRCAQACLVTPECRSYVLDTSLEAPHCCQLFTIPSKTGVRYGKGMTPMFVKVG